MNYEDSEPTEYSQLENEDWVDSVHIRQEDRGVTVYAVFDGEEQVSGEYAPIEDHLCVEFATAYSGGLENGGCEFARDYDERDAADMSELAAQTNTLIIIAFNHIEYILGNADFEDVDINFDKLESLRAALGEMSEYVSSESFLSLSRR